MASGTNPSTSALLITVLVNSSAVLTALPASLVKRCERDSWTLVRTYNGDVGPSWSDAFVR